MTTTESTVAAESVAATPETVAPVETITPVESTTSLEQKIRKQIEFYFGDHNLPRDKFLQAELGKSPEGWIPLSLLTSFNRLKCLSTDVSFIASALASSHLVEVNEEGSCVRRREPVSEAKSMLETSLYVKGFKPEQTLEELEAYFEGKRCEGIAAIRMRRMREDKTFKGSVFLEFPNEQAMQAALEKIRSDDSMIVKTKSEYFNEKSSNNNNNNKRESEEAEDVSKNYTRGCLLRVEGVEEELTHQQVKQAFSSLNAPVSYFEKLEGGNAAWVRFQESKAAEFVAANESVEVKKDNGEVVKLVNLRVATEEEEAEYYEKLSQILKEKSRNNQRGSRRKGGNRNNNNKGNNRKRQLDASEDDGEEETKQAKVFDDQ